MTDKDIPDSHPSRVIPFRPGQPSVAPDGGCVVTLEALNEIEHTVLHDAKAMQRLFAEVYGYTWAKTSFSVDQLAGKTGRNYTPGYCSRYLDHATWYRWPVRPHRPAAIVAQLYDVEGRLDSIQEWADKHGLHATIIQDFPSWHSPGNSVIVVYTREGDFLRRNVDGVNEHPQGRKAKAWESVRQYKELLNREQHERTAQAQPVRPVPPPEQR